MTKNIISAQQVKHVAKLANIPLTEKELSVYSAHLSSIVEYMEKIKNLNLKNVDATARVSEEENVFREDKIVAGFSQTQALKNADQTHQGYFVVPRILEKI